MSKIMNRNNFMERYFHELPIELQHLIIYETYKLPKPKFQKGSIVKYTAKRKKEMYEKLIKLINQNGVFDGKHIGETPFGKLIIWREPYFDYKKYEWIYDYSYGLFGLKEGMTIESDIEPYNM